MPAVLPRHRHKRDDGTHIPLDIEYLLTPGSETPFDLCEINEDVEQLPPRSRKLGALGQLFAALVAVAVVGLILVGAAAVLGWIVR